MQLEPKLEALLKKMGQDDLDDLKAMLVPALAEEIIAVLPDASKSIGALVVGAVQPMAQAAVESLISKVVL